MFTVSGPLSTFRLKRTCTGDINIGITHFHIILILLTDVLSTYIATFTNPISFMNVTIPRLIGSTLGSSEPVHIVPTYFLKNTVFYTNYSLVTHALFSPIRLSVDTIATVFNTPIIVTLVLGGQIEWVKRFIPQPGALKKGVPYLSDPRLTQGHRGTLSTHTRLHTRHLLQTRSGLRAPIRARTSKTPLFHVDSLSTNCSGGIMIRNISLRIHTNSIITLVKPGNSNGSAVLGAVAHRLAPLTNTIRLSKQRVSQ